jgi:hypothetical protein
VFAVREYGPRHVVVVLWFRLGVTVRKRLFSQRQIMGHDRFRIVQGRTEWSFEDLNFFLCGQEVWFVDQRSKRMK